MKLYIICSKNAVTQSIYRTNSLNVSPLIPHSAIFGLINQKETFLIIHNLIFIVKGYFYQIIIFSPNNSPYKAIKDLFLYKKCFLFHQKAFFPQQDIQIFVTFSLSLHSSRCKRSNRSGIIHDVMNSPV